MCIKLARSAVSKEENNKENHPNIKHFEKALLDDKCKKHYIYNHKKATKTGTIVFWIIHLYTDWFYFIIDEFFKNNKWS